MVPTDELADRQTQIQRALRAWHEVLDDPSSYLDHWWLVRSRLTSHHEPLTASQRRRLSNDLLAEGLAELEQIDPVGTRILRDPYTNKPFVGFYVTKRVGGFLADSNAIKLFKFSA